MRTVFHAYEPLVRCIAAQGFHGFSGFSSTPDLDDAVASVFAAAFEPATRLRYDPASPYSAFLGGIARNAIRSHLRKAGRELPLSIDDHADCLPAPEEWNPETATQAGQQTQLVQRFHQHLADPFLQAVADRTLAHGLSEAEAAQALSVTRHQVRKALVLIRKRISSFLAREGLQ